jgi:hypothetical protein
VHNVLVKLEHREFGLRPLRRHDGTRSTLERIDPSIPPSMTDNRRAEGFASLLAIVVNALCVDVVATPPRRANLSRSMIGRIAVLTTLAHPFDDRFCRFRVCFPLLHFSRTIFFVLVWVACVSHRFSPGRWEREIRLSSFYPTPPISR